MADLNEAIAARVLGELHTLTKQIDTLSKQVIGSARDVKQSADLIKTNSELAVKCAKDAAYQAQIASAVQFEAQLSGTIVKTLSKVAGAVATKAAMRWVIAGVAIAGVVTITAGGFGYDKGWDAGKAAGYSKTRDEVAAAAWGNTQEGRLAIQLSEAGSLTKLAMCAERGWTLEKNSCFPSATKEGTYGWRVKK